LSAADCRLLLHFRFRILDDPLNPRSQQCRQQCERARDKPDDDQRFERELGGTAVVTRRSTPRGIVAPFEVIEQAAPAMYSSQRSGTNLSGFMTTTNLEGGIAT
jgi:hypothetical protein